MRQGALARRMDHFGQAAVASECSVRARANCCRAARLHFLHVIGSSSRSQFHVINGWRSQSKYYFRTSLIRAQRTQKHANSDSNRRHVLYVRRSRTELYTRGPTLPPRRQTRNTEASLGLEIYITR